MKQDDLNELKEIKFQVSSAAPGVAQATIANGAALSGAVDLLLLEDGTVLFLEI